MRISVIKLSHLRSEEHFQFLTLVRNLLNLFPAALVLLVTLYESFLALLTQEGLLVDALRSSSLTERLAELDRLEEAHLEFNTLFNQRNMEGPTVPTSNSRTSAARSTPSTGITRKSAPLPSSSTARAPTRARKPSPSTLLHSQFRLLV
jgi:hypothetical protein